MGDIRTFGWQSAFPEFRAAAPRVVRTSLLDFIQDATKEQIRAWDESIPLLQREAGEVIDAESRGKEFTAILEYRLPLESRRPDCVVLLLGPVVVVELKGKDRPSQADLDQVAAYARDLRSYHRECEGRSVHAVLVPTRGASECDQRDGVYVVGPAGLDALLRRLSEKDSVAPELQADEFLREDAYRPLPTLVQAARELMNSRTIRPIWRASADTDKAIGVISKIAHDAAATKTRHLVLLTGVPGSGKTLVGLRIAHAQFLDDLAVSRADGKPSAPAVFLSGNGPLVEVLQYMLKGAGGDGKTFVRGALQYFNAMVPFPKKVPAEHVIVFDEAQRAFDSETVAEKHLEWPKVLHRSEPELMIEIAERVPEWSVVIGLIGTGQEIHVGEEAGLGQWRRAIEGSKTPSNWTVHAPAQVEEMFLGASFATRWTPSLNLNTQMRFHLATALHEWVTCLLEQGDELAAQRFARRLHQEGYRLLATRDLMMAKSYARERYEENADARFGLLASSKDKDLESLGVPNGFQATKNVRRGPWYGGESELSCRRMESVMTEFGAQGLELDFAVLAWGTDFRRVSGAWSNADARGYKRPVVDAMKLRRNAYRVLLTRGRDGAAIFVPRISRLDETWKYLLACGVVELR